MVSRRFSVAFIVVISVLLAACNDDKEKAVNGSNSEVIKPACNRILTAEQVQRGESCRKD